MNGSIAFMTSHRASVAASRPPKAPASDEGAVLPPQAVDLIPEEGNYNRTDEESEDAMHDP